MSRVFNLLNYLIKTAAKEQIDIPQSPPMDWNEVPGSTDAEKLDYLQKEFADLFKDSPNPTLEIYQAITRIKYPETLSEQGTKAYQRFNQIKQTFESMQSSPSAEEKSRVQQILGLLNNNIDLLLQKALEQFNQRYVEEFATLFSSQRMSPANLKTVVEKPGAEVEKKALVESVRILYFQRATKLWQDQLEVLQSDFSPEQIAWIFQGTRTSKIEKMPNYRETAIKVARKENPEMPEEIALQQGIDAIKKFMADNERETTTKFTNMQGKDDLLSNLYHGEWTPKFQELLTSESSKELAEMSLGKLAKEDILSNLGYGSLQYPTSPEDLFFKVPIPYGAIKDSELTPEQLEERNNVKTLIRENPYNLQILQRLLTLGGYQGGDGGDNPLDIKLILNIKVDKTELGPEWSVAAEQMAEYRKQWEEMFGPGAGEFFDEELKADVPLKDLNPSNSNTWIIKAIQYFHQTICDNNIRLTEAAGVKITREKVYADPVYNDYGLNFRSQAERKLVNMFREDFGLQTVPFPLGIPKIDGCTAAVSGFQIDFMIPADCITNWSNVENTYHPSIKYKMVFVGEYFGYDRNTPKPVDVPEDEGFRDIDGNIAKITRKDGTVLEAYNGTELTVGEHYKLKTRWKKMTHDFVSSVTGNASILVDENFNQGSIAEQLNKSGILYQSRIMAADSPLAIIKKHLPQCNWGECDSRKYLNENGQLESTKENEGASYIRCCLADLEIQHTLKPSMYAKNEQGEMIFSREKIHAFYIKKQEIIAQIINLRRTREYTPEKEAALENQLKLIDVYVKEMVDEINKNRESENYINKKSKLMSLLENVKSGMITNPQDIVKLAAAINPYWIPYTEKRKPVSNSELLYKIAISS
jgi:hypothetical protein